VISLVGNSLLILAILGAVLALGVSLITSFRKLDEPEPKALGRESYYPESINNQNLNPNDQWIPDSRFAKGLKALATLASGMTTSSIILLLTNIAIISAFFLLVYAFISSDFSVRNVFLNSSTIKPLIYKIAGSWASHEGSMLLYLTLLSTISSLYVKVSNYSSDTRNVQITILSFIQALFLCFIYFTSNPFDSFKFVPEQGLGLNPVLQDKALSIHPPLLYMGYVTYIVTYVNGLLLLLKPLDRPNILRNNLLFSSLALMFLTAGIGLGSWWAYRELGWGGYWFFDPVENISLMPWLVGIALHHFLLITIKTGRFLHWSILTSILAFLLTIYGVFFVRSGIISSVHSFAFSAERGLYLFVICGVLSLGAVVIAWVSGARGHKTSLRAHAKWAWQSREVGSTPNFLRLPRALHTLAMTWSLFAPRNDAKAYTILIGNILWLAACGALFIALIYPLYYAFINDIDVAIDPVYFHKIFIPIFVPIMLMASIAPYVSKINLRSLIYVFISFGAVMIFHHYAKDMGVISGSIIFASVFLMTQMLDFAIMKTNYLRQSISSSQLSLIMGHFSLGLLAFTITANVLFSEEIEFIGRVGDSAKNTSFSVRLNNVKFSDGVVYYRQIAEFMVQDNRGNIVILKPENRLYKIENALSQESDIYSYLTYDMFAVLSKIEGETIHAIIYYRPMIYFIWLSVFLMSMTFLIYILGKRR
jgi:cytochrome c-type biogenesis protein CcmF